MPETTPRADIAAAEAFELLSNDRRRATIVAVAEAAEPLTVDALTTMIASREKGFAPQQLDEDIRRRVRIDLTHHQLPKLVATDVVREYDGDRYAPGQNLSGLVAAAEAALPHLS